MARSGLSAGFLASSETYRKYRQSLDMATTLDREGSALEEIPLLPWGGGTKKLERSVSTGAPSKLQVTICILLVELAERVTFFSVIANMVLFCTVELDYTSATAVSISHVFIGMSLIVPLVGIWVADSYLGKCKAIVISAIIHFLGSALLPVMAFPFDELLEHHRSPPYSLTDSQKEGIFLLALLFISVGIGGIKANVSAFGAYQLRDLGEQELQSFFNWWIWLMNVASAMACLAISYIQQEVDFYIGYLIPAVAMLVALLALYLGRKSYVHLPPSKVSPLATTLRIVFQATKNTVRWRGRLGGHVDSWLDRAKESCGGSYSDTHVEMVKKLERIFPVFLVQVLNRTVFYQIPTTFFLQAMRLNLDVGSTGIVLPIAALNLFAIIPILLLVPLMDRVVYPMLEMCNIRPSPLKRMGAGHFLGLLAILVAAGMEIARKNVIEEGGVVRQWLGGVPFNASSINALWLGPQYLLVGTGEVFVMSSGIEFAYTEAPAPLSTVVMGLVGITMGLGSLTGAVLINVVNAATPGTEWYPDEPNEGYLEAYLFLLAALGLLNFVAFCGVASRYKYVAQEEEERERDTLRLVTYFENQGTRADDYDYDDELEDWERQLDALNYSLTASL
ncbi:solute carrier family 15 member 5-like [Branchiostoma floridae]|uniref:Solute carrier family 15 member 5-like n=1 Tax=Branchiostoma floridae TaxID=7739 RepID=A0A9J7MJE8_BRAFL|nr:solute carrier family 15 member 5-like [Branchiostoma floridae]